MRKRLSPVRAGMRHWLTSLDTIVQVNRRSANNAQQVPVNRTPFFFNESPHVSVPAPWLVAIGSMVAASVGARCTCHV